MVLDIILFRTKGGNPELIRESQRRRFKSVEIVDEIIKLDEEWRIARGALDVLNAEYGKINKKIAEKKKAGENADELISEAKALDAKMKIADKELDIKKEAVDKKLYLVGNLVHESVPVSKDEEKNGLVRVWGEDIKRLNKNELLNHHEVLSGITGYDAERGVKVAGHRAYFLRGPGVLLNQALINYGLAFLGAKGYIPLQPPFFMNRDIMSETAQLEQFDEELYKVSLGGDEADKYLIATSEQPISGYHRGEWLDPKELPLRYAGVSSCFRKEAGAHGKDVWGIFRVHQFEKVEQFVLTDPEKSWEEHENMIKLSEEFYQSLELPYRVVAIVSGSLNNAAAKKYDLEAWFPARAEYRELVSCSNCTDYQSRSLEVRFGIKKMGDREKKYVHMLNSTLVATERAICCIMENYQTPEGVKIPKVLQPFMGGVDFIAWTNGVKPKKAKN